MIEFWFKVVMDPDWRLIEFGFKVVLSGLKSYLIRIEELIYPDWSFDKFGKIVMIDPDWNLDIDRYWIHDKSG
jgi:hypothetical protein